MHPHLVATIEVALTDYYSTYCLCSVCARVRPFPSCLVVYCQEHGTVDHRIVAAIEVALTNCVHWVRKAAAVSVLYYCTVTFIIRLSRRASHLIRTRPRSPKSIRPPPTATTASGLPRR